MDKGYKKKASDGMQWLDIETVRQIDEFVDLDGKPKQFSMDDDDEAEQGPAPAPLADDGGMPWEVDDDGDVF
jgi:putative DNA primase/helicase